MPLTEMCVCLLLTEGQVRSSEGCVAVLTVAVMPWSTNLNDFFAKPISSFLSGQILNALAIGAMVRKQSLITWMFYYLAVAAAGVAVDKG